MTNFNFLPFNKNCKFKCDLDEHLVRTGMIEKNPLLSLVNAVLFSTSKKYNDIKNSDDKVKYVYDFYEYIINKFNGEVNKDFKMDVINDFNNLYLLTIDFINEDGEYMNEKMKKEIQNNFEVFSLIVDIIEDDFSIILKKSLKGWNSCKYDDLRRSLMKEILRYLEYVEILDNLENEKQDFIKRKMCLLFDLILDEIREKRDEPKLESDVNNELVKFIADYFDCNIYFLDAESKSPIKSEINYEDNTSIIILSFDKKHFEPISKYVEEEKKLIKEFKPNEDVLQSFKF